MTIVLDVVLPLLCGLSLFLFGMDVMGDALKKSAGNGLKTILGKMTSNPVKGFLLGLGVTAIIQSSSATTVMVVGFVNSGTMTLVQSVGVIMGANVGTAVTAWLTGLSGIEGSGQSAFNYLDLLKTDAWMPILAVIGICLILFVKRGKKRDIGFILVGFAVLMVGMSLMSDSVKGIDQNVLGSILTTFKNPVLGVLAGMILTAIVQSSSASIGILQALSVTGAIDFGMAIPIILGQNIGTCITAMLSSIGASRNGKRAAIVHLYFNVIGVVFWLSAFYIVNAFVHFPFLEMPINMWGIAGVHTIFKILSVALISPFYRQLELLARLTIKEKKDESETVNMLDERLFATPAVAANSATTATYKMAELACDSIKRAMTLLDEFDPKIADEIRDIESKVDTYEDTLGSYLVKLSSVDMTERDSLQITKLLHIIGDLERISDHAVNIVESAEEMKDKKLSFSDEAKRELKVMRAAIADIVSMTYQGFISNDVNCVLEVDPLEEVVDRIRDTIKKNHVNRLRKSECTIEHGFVLSDLLTNFERVSDHCSNIAGCVFEISSFDALDLHKYSQQHKSGDEAFDAKVNEFTEKYKLAFEEE